MTHTLLALSFGFVGLILATNAGFAATQCAARDTVLKMLAETYSETPRSMGLAANNGLVEVFVSDSTRSWTITVTLPNGTTCLIASGQSFEPVQDTRRAPGQPA